MRQAPATNDRTPSGLPSLTFCLLLLGTAFLALVLGCARSESESLGERTDALTTPTVRSTSSASANNATSLTITSPAGTALNDVLVAFISLQGASDTITPPAGWTALSNTNVVTSATGTRYEAFYKVAGSSEPSSYTFSRTAPAGGSYDISGGMFDISGADTTAPINASGAQANASTTSCTAPSITTTVANTLLLFGCTSDGSATATPPSGMTESWDLSSSGTYPVEHEAATAAQSTAAATGTRSATLSASHSNLGIVVAVTPAASSTTTTTTTTAPVIRSTAKASANNATSLTIPGPAGTMQNDALVAFIALQGAHDTILPPSGWTALANTDVVTSSTGVRYEAFWKVAGSSEPASYTFSRTAPAGGSYDISGGIFDISGADTTSPINVSGAQVNASSTSCTAPSLTTTTANALLLFGCTSDGSATATPPSGMAEAWDFSTSGTYPVEHASANAAQATAAATGTRTATLSVSHPNAGILVAVAPGGSSGSSGSSGSGGSSDTTPPAAVTNLATSSPSSSSMLLSWTAPGDDGTAGTATTYDLRYSASPITGSNWANATQVSGEPAPAAAGTVQSMTVSGLAASTAYYFAIKTADEASNWSSLSNVASGTTTASGSSVSADYYVSGSIGSDSNSGTSASAPFRTIQKAADVVAAGQTVLVDDGVYSMVANDTCGSAVVCIKHGGTSSQYVRFISKNKWGAILDGTNGSAVNGFVFGSGVDYVEINGFEIRNVTIPPPYTSGSSCGIEVYSGGNGARLIGNNIHDVGRVCATTTNGLSGIYLNKSGVLIKGNLIHDLGRTFQEGTCTSGDRRHDHGIYHSAGDNVTIVDNVVYNIKHGWGVQEYPSSRSGVKILNNTFAFPNPEEVGHIIIYTITMTDSFIQNNLFYQPLTDALRIYSSTLSNVLISNNMTYAGNISDSPGSGTYSSNWDQTNPLFVNAGGYNFHLTSTSPAIDRGVTKSEVPDDFLGRTRPVGAAYDLGAYEDF